MKIAVISRSDSNGGAAVVSRRLTEALREQGHEATLLVLEKQTDLPYVVKANYPLLSKVVFLLDRLDIFIHDGFSRTNLFKTDSGRFGLPLWRHPVVREADAVIINWVNQGMMSLKGVEKICKERKKVVWTMHDMWNLTGICHHSMECRRFEGTCCDCPLLGKGGGRHDLAWKTQRWKKRLYDRGGITFVAVSRWLLDKARQSSLLGERKVELIANPYKIKEPGERKRGTRRRILFSAATIDNWIKGLDTFREAVRIVAETRPDLAEDAEIAFAGNVKNPDSLLGFALPTIELGYTSDEDGLLEHFSHSDVIVNSSYFESFGLILMEGQAYGCVPVAFDRGGQGDIIDHLQTGYLAPWSDNPRQRAENLAAGIVWALENRNEEMIERMRSSVKEKFGYAHIARRYMEVLGRP